VYTLLEKFVLRSNTAVMGARYADEILKGPLEDTDRG
jgi:hypothetical protein